MGIKLYKFAVLTSALGLLSIAAVMISGTAYPDLLFQVLAPAGLLLIFASLGLYALGWIFSMINAVKSKRYPYAVMLLFVGMLYVVRMIATLNKGTQAIV